MGIDEATFYDVSRIAIVPMSFCFPGLDDKGGDLPPRRECVRNWHDRLFGEMPQIELLLTIGTYAQAYHLGNNRASTLTETVGNFRQILEDETRPAVLPLPHPSWRNNAWLKKNPWFADDLLPVLRERVRQLL